MDQVLALNGRQADLCVMTPEKAALGLNLSGKRKKKKKIS